MPDGGLLPAICQAPIPVASGGCRGWLHQAAGGTGVLMVGAVGFEELCVHRAWRDLGARFARVGMPALRLTLPGTGDAPEPDGLPDLVPRWLDAIAAASEWMRQALGLDEVVPCGFHLGALLVAHAAARTGGTGRLALLAPAVSGKQFLRAQQVRAQMNSFPADLKAERLEVPGLHLHREAAQGIESLSLLKLGCAPARRMLLLERKGAGEPGVLARALTAQGAEVQAGTFKGYDALMNDAHISKQPDAAWRHVVAWLGENEVGLHPPARSPRSAPSLPEKELAGTGWVERSIRISTAQGVALAGVHTGPTGELPKGLAVMVCSVGANPNAGHGRGAAHLSRCLAASGTWSMRFDFAGIGESGGEEDVDLAHLYDPARVAETRAVLDWLCSAGHERFVLVGICSGAFQAMQAGLADGRVAGLVLANQMFYGTWQAGGLGGWQRRREARASRARRQADDSPGHVTLRSPAPEMPRHQHLLQMGLKVALRLERQLVKASRLIGLGMPRRRLRALAARGARTVVLVSENDDALTLLEMHSGPNMRGLAGIDGVEVLVAPPFDHPLGMAAAQHLLLTTVKRLLAELRLQKAVLTTALS